MKILHLITTLDVGGAETHLLSLCRGQVQREHEVRVAYLKGEGRLAGEFRDAGVREVKRLRLGLGAPTRLVEAMYRADVVHTHLLKADALGSLFATLFLRRSHLIASKHNDEAVLKKWPVALLHGLLGRAPRRTIVLSDHVLEYMATVGKLPRKGMTRIHYGLDPRPFDGALELSAERRLQLREEFGLETEHVVFVCVARFAPQKAHGDLLHAVAAAREDAPQLRLLLVGDDPFGDGRREAEALAAELGVDDIVHFAGIRRDIPRLLAISDGFVLASHWEGFGLVFLEAMAAHLPIVATRISAIPEVVAEDETGLLVPVAAPAELGAALARLATDPALRVRLGEAGRARLESEFGLDRMVDAVLDVYRANVPGLD